MREVLFLELHFEMAAEILDHRDADAAIALGGEIVLFGVRLPVAVDVIQVECDRLRFHRASRRAPTRFRCGLQPQRRTTAAELNIGLYRHHSAASTRVTGTIIQFIFKVASQC